MNFFAGEPLTRQMGNDYRLTSGNRILNEARQNDRGQFLLG